MSLKLYRNTSYFFVNFSSVLLDFFSLNLQGKILKRALLGYRVTHKGIDFKDDRLTLFMAENLI